VLDGQVTGVQQAIGTPRARETGARYLREFVDEAKRSGLVAKTIERNEVRGVIVAP
jgi:polar amino acid transport system substrate-binding protein